MTSLERQAPRTDLNRYMIPGVPSFAGAPYTVDYFDFNSLATISSAPFRASLLDPLLLAGGMLPTYPQVGRFASGTAGSRHLTCRLKLWGIALRFHETGAQDTTLIPADTYNTLRSVLFWTGNTYSEQASILPILTNVDEHVDMKDVVEIFIDRRVVLLTRAFDSNDSNVPGSTVHQAWCPLNIIVDTFSTNEDGTASWDTKSGNLLLDRVSDSTVTPDPTSNCNFRVYYSIVD